MVGVLLESGWKYGSESRDKGETKKGKRGRGFRATAPYFHRAHHRGGEQGGTKGGCRDKTLWQAGKDMRGGLKWPPQVVAPHRIRRDGEPFNGGGLKGRRGHPEKCVLQEREICRGRGPPGGVLNNQREAWSGEREISANGEENWGKSASQGKELCRSPNAPRRGKARRGLWGTLWP